MLRKILCVVFGLAVLLGSTSALAAPRTGTIGIMLEREGAVTLYRVGDAGESSYRLLDCYGGMEVSFDDILSPDLAAWLAQEVTGGTERKAVDGLVTFTELEQGVYLLVQTSAPGYYPFSPFLVSIPWDGDQWSVQANPKIAELLEEIPHTGDNGILFAAMALMLVSGLSFFLWTSLCPRKEEDLS